jgi:hypothetical protein
MANADAWQAGIDIAQGRKQKKQDGDSAPTDAWQSGVDLAQGAMQKKTLKRAKQPTGLETTQPTLTATIPSFKKGGRVRKTGLIYAHRGERVIPAKRPKRASRSRKTFITR